MQNPASKVGAKLFFGRFGCKKNLIPTSVLGVSGTCNFLPKTCFFRELRGLNLGLTYFANNSNVFEDFIKGCYMAKSCF